ncbi:MAG: LD-carboxypeptidase [Fusobacterium sp.]|nr:LD-carboxypeptidase [Fusobacterium sp.]
MNIVKPKKLQKGDCVGIIAPCGVFKAADRLEKGIEFLQNAGFRVKVSDKLFARQRYMAGTDEERAGEIEKFFADDEVDGIICARGGYGAIRLIDKINYDVIRANPKVFCGFSDVTALSAMFLKRAGLVTYSAPMINGDFGNDISDFTWENFQNAVMSDELLEFEGEGQGCAEGISFGGNLATLVSLCGVDFLPDEDFILFIEDLNEPAYKIDRMVTQLRNIEKFRQNLKGVVLGEFTDCDCPEYWDEIFAEFGVPTVKGLKITHSHDKITVPIGVPARIEDGKFILNYSYV